jgi:ribokinase
MIVVFGSNILDQFFELPDLDFFKNDRGEDAIHLHGHTEAPGGKGANQAVAAALAGADVRFFGAVGEGGHGRALIKNFQSHGINTNGILLTETPTGVASIMNLPGGKHRIVVSQGANVLAKQSQVADELLQQKPTLLLQAELNPTENEGLILRAANFGCRIILNIAPAKPLSRAALEKLSYLIVNEAEAEATCKHLGLSTGKGEEMAVTLATALQLTAIVTMGEKGAVAVEKNNLARIIAVPALSITAVDSVGAGDAFCGAFAEAIDRGDTFENALRRGAVAGSLACTKVGAQTALPNKLEIDQHLVNLGASVFTAPPVSGIAGTQKVRA